MRLFIAALAIAPVLAACGSSHSADTSAGEPKFESIGDVVNTANLRACVPSDAGHAYVTEETCGDRAVVLFFDTPAQRSKWVSTYLVNGLPSGAAVLYDDRWGIACPQASTCSAIKDSMGGTLKPDGSDG